MDGTERGLFSVSDERRSTTVFEEGVGTACVQETSENKSCVGEECVPCAVRTRLHIAPVRDRERKDDSDDEEPRPKPSTASQAVPVRRRRRRDDETEEEEEIEEPPPSFTASPMTSPSEEDEGASTCGGMPNSSDFDSSDTVAENNNASDGGPISSPERQVSVSSSLSSTSSMSMTMKTKGGTELQFSYDVPHTGDNVRQVSTDLKDVAMAALSLEEKQQQQQHQQQLLALSSVTKSQQPLTTIREQTNKIDKIDSVFDKHNGSNNR